MALARVGDERLIRCNQDGGVVKIEFDELIRRYQDLMKRAADLRSYL